jgi:glyoxylase-like metal-dependent hydrolase (beta-lactamase superfamily II)
LEELGKLGAIGEKGVKIWKFRCEVEKEAGEKGKDCDIEGMLEGVEKRLIDIRGLEDGARLVEEGEGKIRALRNGQKFRIEGKSEDVELEVVHTPGHTTDSISILLRTTETPLHPASRSKKSPVALFSFDTVLGHGTAVFSSLATYLSSLSSLISLLSPTSTAPPPSSSSESQSPIPIYPGHGPVIEDGVAKLKEYRKHRLDRENQVVEALKNRRSERVTASS